jgi:3-hydroxybutyryl-CoA dehydrogenase
MEVKRVAVIGAGTMGRGIAQVAALGGFETHLFDVDGAAVARAVDAIGAALKKGVELGKVAPEAAVAALEKLRPSHRIEEAAGASDLVIEAVPEDIRLKIETFTALDQHAPPAAILATNTSALSITEIAGATRRPERVIGMHFFNPVHLMKLVEVVRALQTGDETQQVALAAVRRMGKEPVLVNESPGFVTTRINAMIGNEAFYMLQEGVASAADIDKALKLGLNHPMGPFELVDLVGLDTRLAILMFLHRTLGEKFRPCPLLEKYVKAGRLGKKVGRGVYDYAAGGLPAKDGAPKDEGPKSGATPARPAARATPARA